MKPTHAGSEYDKRLEVHRSLEAVARELGELELIAVLARISVAHPQQLPDPTYERVDPNVRLKR